MKEKTVPKTEFTPIILEDLSNPESNKEKKTAEYIDFFLDKKWIENYFNEKKIEKGKEA